ncbi:hypothetical protein BGZ63DRAFT_418914 [Mariannaea sp. PMI_226]|nr:hypothetical protein BGZ63DRAFT_418914 [Mariannaea sp. PMI_226]
MATFFQSFRSSSMPKRLLRYALSRLELLDAEALDMENLDLALGLNSVFEFRDVGIKLKKLEKLLQLPATFKLHKSKVLLLRVTIPMDFYTSPIIIEVDGVDIVLQVLGTEPDSSHTPGTKMPEEPASVPNTFDLAQSFLETQPKSERRKLEDSLAAEIQDPGASITMSEDGSEDEFPVGTGQALSLPAFLADFLQGIVDRMQIKIKGVKFQLDVEVPVEPTSTTTEPVSFQIALDRIDIEGVTSQIREQDGSPIIVPKEGKRHISLSDVRAYLVSEANVFSALAKSPSMTSPSVASSPIMTKNPPSRQTSDLSSHSMHDELMSAMHESLKDSISRNENVHDDAHLEDSEDGLDIPYDLSQPAEDELDESPATPKASLYHDFNNQSPERTAEPAEPSLDEDIDGPLFHSTVGPSDHISHSFAFEDERPHWASVERGAGSVPTFDLPFRPSYPDSLRPSSPGAHLESSVSTEGSFRAGSVDELAESHLYTREEAESMYMSAFSQNEPQNSTTLSPSMSQHTLPPPEPASDLAVSVAEEFQPSLEESPSTEESQSTEESPSTEETQPALDEPEPATEKPEPVSEGVELPVNEVVPEEAEKSKGESQITVPRPQTPRMPGAWDDDSDDSPPPSSLYTSMSKRVPRGKTVVEEEDSDYSEPAFSRAWIAEEEPERSTISEKQPDDAPTPKGPTRLVKEILSLKTVSIYVPSQHQHIQVQGALSESVAQMSQSMGRSVYPQAPGAFSIHGAPSTVQSQSPPALTEGAVDSSFEITLSPISINFDASLGFLLAMVVSKLLEALKDNQPPATVPQASELGSPKKAADIKVKVEEIRLNFLNRLGGVTDTSERYLDPTAFIFDQEVLLSTIIQSLSISVSPIEVSSVKADRRKNLSQSATLTRIDLQKFRFGYANGDIVSFDRGKPMSTSVRDTFLSSGSDIAIKILETDGNIKTDVETLPLVVQIDLQRLDETFSWFGGFSSFLNMSASMASSPSPTPKAAVIPQQKPRGVRFDTPIDPGDKSAASENKLNLRIGGAFVELLGRDCSVAAETTALKLVSRDEGIGMGCNMMRLSGPYLKNSAADPAINCELTGVRLDFLMAPQDSDLERLLELIIPTKVKFDPDDEIMVDTLLRQRRKGSVLRTSVEAINFRMQNMSQLSVLPNLGEELAKLSTVAKYLPEDDRPGLLTLGKLQKIGVSLDFGGKLGHLGAEIHDLHVGHITVPSLLAIAIHGISVKRNRAEELIGSSAYGPKSISSRGPVIMARMIGDEIEPVIKLKMQDVNIEYRVSTIMDFLDLEEDATPQDFEASLAASVANLGDQAHHALARQPSSLSGKAKEGKPMTLDISFRDVLLGLNPLGRPSKMIVALTDAHLVAVLPKEVDTNAILTINKASVLLIDDIAQFADSDLPVAQRPRASSSTSRQVADLCARGFVDICYMSSAKVVVDVKAGEDGEKFLNVDLRDDLLVLETCADSTQTLISLANALKPPTPASKENKYRTDVIPVQDLLASISAEAFGKPEGEYDFDQDFAGAQEMAGSGSDAYSTDSPLQIESQFYQEKPVGEELFDASSSSILLHETTMQDTKEGVLLNFDQPSVTQGSDTDDLEIHEDYYGREESKDGTAKIWNTNKNTYDRAPVGLVERSPVKVSVRDVHLIWNLFDGYDWVHTRDVITQAVQEVETKAYERQARAGPSNLYEEEFEDEEAIGDFLFNSIYIGIPANRDPQELSRAINEGLNDNATETESVATTTFTASTNRTARSRPQPKSKRLRLKRSKRHKITFELQGVNVDLIAYPAGVTETQSSIDVKVKNLDIFDHVPTSTWKKFVTYDQDMGEREMDTSMVHLELLNIKPQPNLEASEIVLRATLLPLRLHVDQDALDFITRFFEFKDENVPVHSSPSDIPFLQRAEVMDIPVKLDFKPKRVDYAGLRSGHTTEFMNFIVLEEARMVLRHVILYGVSGFDRLGKTLNDIWMPDVKANQLPGVLAGLAPVRPLVNVGSGFRHLVEVPLREYQKDGRVVRSISKGAAAFARTTGTELVKLGAKLAVGTQYALQGAEGMLTEQAHQQDVGWEDDDLDPEEKKVISLYADQPTGVISGLRGGYRSLARDVNLARDAIIAVPGEVMSSQSATGAARAVLKHAPTIIFRPAVGVTKALGQTLMGATNSMDPQNRRRIEEKYKRH